MVIISTRATEVSIQAVSPPEGVQFVTTAGTAATAAYLSVASTAATAAAQAGVAGGAGLAAAGAAVAAGAAAAGAAAAGASSACEGLSPVKLTNAAIASAGARPVRNRDSFISGNSNGNGCGSPQRASESFSPVRMRTAESMP